jgi:tRNA(Ile)-lysidine synthase TilS/MesJ
MKRCSRCILPETYPGICFDEQDVCNFCKKYDAVTTRGTKRDEYRKKFEQLVEECKGKSSYDVLVCYSGGKDSTYTLSLLKKKYGLNPLAITYDNGFQSERALRNARNVVDSLSVDYMLFRPRVENLKVIFRGSATGDLYPAKSQERTSAICTSCLSIVKFGSIRIAIEKQIPLIAFGWSPGQAPIASAVAKSNPQMLKSMQNVTYKVLHDMAGDIVRPYFLEEWHFAQKDAFPYHVSPLAFEDYDEKTIKEEISLLGWEAPTDTDANSTNCLLNAYANRVHKEKYKFHPYEFEVAGLIRAGHLSRDEGLERVTREEDADIVAGVKKSLGL